MPLSPSEYLASNVTKNTAALQRCLATPQRPMVVSRMNGWHRHRYKAITCGTDELAVRTARSLQSFQDPLILSSLRSANAARLRWAQTFSAREFNFCTTIEVLAEQYVEQQQQQNAELARQGAGVSSPQLDFGTITMGCSAHGCHRVATSFTNTDDTSPLFADADNGLATSSSLGPTLADLASDGCSTASVESLITLSETEQALADGRIQLDTIPFEVALQILRPQQPLLNIMVNEISIRSAGLNYWFSCFCRRRVSWRVLHEHLLHVTRPDQYSSIVNDATNIRELLKEACEVVADLYSKITNRQADDVTVTFHVEEDASILTTTPPGQFLSSSADGDDGRVDAATSSIGGVLPPVSDRVYSVEGHLGYTFRELLKNACVASLRVSNTVAVTMRYAEDDRWVVVDFIDAAHGIPPNHAEDIWKFGWTTSEHYESHLGGFGVGLPISKVYMDMWGGSIRMYSDMGRGTVARVRFPKSPVEILVPDFTLAYTTDSSSTSR